MCPPRKCAPRGTHFLGTWPEHKEVVISLSHLHLTYLCIFAGKVWTESFCPQWCLLLGKC